MVEKLQVEGGEIAFDVVGQGPLVVLAHGMGDTRHSYRFDIGQSQWLAFVRGENLTDQTVRYASSILRDIAPAPGRSVEVGLRTTF